MDNDERSEFKFLLLAHHFEPLLLALAPGLLPDPHTDSEGFYSVISLYYDSPAHDCFWDAVKGVTTRRKLRIRTYGTHETAGLPSGFLEIKYRTEGRGSKKRIQTSLSNALQIANGAGAVEEFSTRDLQTIEEVYQLVRGEFYRPTCLIRYKRRAYTLRLEGHSPCGEVRLTFDNELRAGLFDLQLPLERCPTPYALLPEGQRILEIKCRGELPAQLSRQLARQGIKPRRFSKYCSALTHEIKPFDTGGYVSF